MLKGECVKMKFKKILVGLMAVFSLTAFSVNVTAKKESKPSKPESYFLSIMKNCNDETTRKAISTVIWAIGTFSNYYSFNKDPALKKFIEERFINKNRELKEFNREDLDELFKLLNAKLEEIEKNYKNFANSQNASQNGYVKNIISYLKDIIPYIKKIKNNEIPKEQLNEILKVFEKLDIKRIYKEYMQI